MTNILFLHAHPDDEAIFTGGTIRALSDAGHQVTIVFATSGELGNLLDDKELRDVRIQEAIIACEILGADNVRFLGYHDSGLDQTNFPEGSLALCDRNEAAAKVADILRELEIDAIFCDDSNGIYGHPDHKTCHAIAIEAARLHGLECVTEFTVDGEHLHFVESHVVKTAFDAFGITADSPLYRGNSSRQHPGLTTVEISNSYTVNGSHLKAKRDAMAAHTSQIKPDSEPLIYSDNEFAQVYGLEWFRHLPLTAEHNQSRSVFDDLR